MAINNNNNNISASSLMAQTINNLGDNELSLKFGDVRLQSTYVSEKQAPRYAEGWNVPISNSKGGYQSYRGFYALKSADSPITHVQLCSSNRKEVSLIELAEPAFFGQTLWSEMPQEVQDYYLKVVEHLEAKDNKFEQETAEMEAKIQEVLEKYPTAYIVYDVSGRQEKKEGDTYDNFRLYCPMETEWGPIKAYVYGSRYQHREGNALMTALERDLSKCRNLAQEQAALIAAYPNCFAVKGVLYANVEYKGVTKELRLGADCTIEHYKKEVAKFHKSVDYELKQKEAEQAFNARNEAIAALILKKFPKAQILRDKQTNGLWCVNVPHVDMLTFCKQNKVLIPKHLL
jgi:menaquinone-dependent protoporphyrinogen IX oxidase